MRGGALDRLRSWLSQYDWGAIIGAALVFIFYIGVISPVIEGLPASEHQPQQQSSYAAPDQAAIEKYIASESFWQRTRDDPIAFYTLVSAVFAGVLSIFTIGLWYVTWRTLKHAQGDAIRQWRQTRVGNQAAIRAANAAQIAAEAAVGAERAWIVIMIDADNLEEAILQRIEPNGDADGEVLTPEARFHVENLGRTPAFIREYTASLVCQPDQGIPEMEYEPLAPWWPEETILAAGARLPAKENDPDSRVAGCYCFSTELAKGLEPEAEPRGRFWLFGRIVYADVWGTVHTTTYCFASDVWSGWYIAPGTTELNQRT